MEIEVNQKYVTGEQKESWEYLCDRIADAFHETVSTEDLG